VKNNNCVNRRVILFRAAEGNQNLYEVNNSLVQNGFSQTSPEEYSSWQAQVYPLLKSNMLYFNEFVIKGDLTLSGLVRSINNRRINGTIS